MSKFKRNTVLVGAIALAFAGGSALAGGPVGVIPFDGDGSGNGFTIDNAGFVFADVDAAPCPVGSTCTNMTATTDNVLLMREVDTGVARYVQTIIVDTNGTEEFTSEGIVSTGGGTNNQGSKVRINDDQVGTSNDFFTEQSMYRGSLFGASNGPVPHISVEVFQSISGGFQTFDMETTDALNQGNNPHRNGRLQILQPASGPMQAFGHTELAGQYVTASGTLTAGSQSVTYAAGAGISATWIGGAMSGGGPGVILAPGQLTNHDTRPAADRDFGLLIYRVGGNNAAPGLGNAGGTPAGLVNPQFTQTAPVGGQARAFSASGVTDTGLMYNPAHGSFTGGAAILAADWNAVFGANPY